MLAGALPAAWRPQVQAGGSGGPGSSWAAEQGHRAPCRLLAALRSSQGRPAGSHGAQQMHGDGLERRQAAQPPGYCGALGGAPAAAGCWRASRRGSKLEQHGSRGSMGAATRGGSRQHGSSDAGRSQSSAPPPARARRCMPAAPLPPPPAYAHPPPPPRAASAPQMAKGDKRQEVCTREYTINLGKRLHGITFKKRAPRAIKEIQKFAAKQMGTKVVRVDVKLNKAVWSQVRGAGRAAEGGCGSGGGLRRWAACGGELEVAGQASGSSSGSSSSRGGAGAARGHHKSAAWAGGCGQVLARHTRRAWGLGPNGTAAARALAAAAAAA